MTLQRAHRRGATALLLLALALCAAPRGAAATNFPPGNQIFDIQTSARAHTHAHTHMHSLMHAHSLSPPFHLPVRALTPAPPRAPSPQRRFTLAW
jgi:hypothetical protein